MLQFLAIFDWFSSKDGRLGAPAAGRKQCQYPLTHPAPTRLWYLHDEAASLTLHGDAKG